jgi:hypothetical protein
MKDDLSNYKYYKPIRGEIIDYLTDHYDELRKDFFENIVKSKVVDTKPGYKFPDGVTDLYNGTIISAGLKLSAIAVDKDEREILNWTPGERYRHSYDKFTPKVTGPWVDFVKKYDHMLEQVFFNIAYPGATITPHRGINSSYFRVHICLQENQGFYFDIEGEKKHWYEGIENAFAFDDGNVKHGVFYEEKNNPQPRIVVILDIKKEFYPDLFKRTRRIE